MRTLIRPFAAWMCVAVVLLQAGVASSRLVLCLEPDGAVNLEAASAGDGCGECPDSVPFGVTDGRRASSSPDSCPCVDVVVASHVERVRTGHDPVALLQFAGTMVRPAPFDCEPDPGCASWVGQPASARGRGPGTLVASVVLRV